MLGLGLSLLTGGSLRPYYAVVAAAFKDRVEADGGTVESMSCLKADLKVLNTIKPPAYSGLLNDYSGAAAAYSLRLLDTSYTGDAIVVRRASDSATQAIGFVNNELDTATLESFCSGTDGFVTTWYDQSGNGNNATQTTASAQPQIVSSGSTILDGGKPSILINATSVSSSVRLQTQEFSLTQPFTMFGVATAYDVSDNTQQLTDNRDSTVSAGLAIQVNSNAYAIGAGGLLVYKNPAINGSAIHYGLFNGSNSNEGYNGSTANSNAGYNGANGITIGGARGIGSPVSSSYGWVGSIYELIVYDVNQSTNRTGIETNINEYYSIY